MKITDLFSRIQKGSADSEAGKAARLIKPVQPVGHVGRLTLVPGQLLQGEVVGEDVNGLLLIKLAGEIISARTAIKLEPGQQFWFEVKEAGDSPLLNLAGQKGAIQDLLKDIMATRLLLVKSHPDGTSPASPGLQAEKLPGAVSQAATAAGTPQAAADLGGPSSAPAAGQPVTPGPVVAADGSLPPEAARLVRALVAYMNQPQEVGVSPAKTGALQAPPLIKTITSLLREGGIPASLHKVKAFQDVIRPTQPLVSPLGSEAPIAKLQQAGGELSSTPASAVKAAGQAQLPAAAGDLPSSPLATSFSPDTIKILNALVAVAGIKAPVAGDGGVLQPALVPDRNLAAILTMIAHDDKIPLPLQRLAPLQALMATAPGVSSALKAEGLPDDLSVTDIISSQQPAAGSAMLPLQFSAAQQGGESLPAQLRLLASLMGLGAREVAVPDGWQELEEIFGRLSKAEMPAAARKLASFFEAHSRVNAEPAPQGQSDFYIMPSIFSGQAGWGEWLWSRERSSGDSHNGSQENLVFFLEMSNLGALTIQVILSNKKLRGQIVMSDKKGSELVAALLPGLRERLEAFGYDVVDFPCSCKPLNVMQELKESLYSQAGSGPASLLDVQA